MTDNDDVKFPVIHVLRPPRKFSIREEILTSALPKSKKREKSGDPSRSPSHNSSISSNDILPFTDFHPDISYRRNSASSNSESIEEVVISQTYLFPERKHTLGDCKVHVHHQDDLQLINARSDLSVQRLNCAWHTAESIPLSRTPVNLLESGTPSSKSSSESSPVFNFLFSSSSEVLDSASPFYDNINGRSRNSSLNTFFMSSLEYSIDNSNNCGSNRSLCTDFDEQQDFTGDCSRQQIPTSQQNEIDTYVRDDLRNDLTSTDLPPVQTADYVTNAKNGIHQYTESQSLDTLPLNEYKTNVKRDKADVCSSDGDSVVIRYEDSLLRFTDTSLTNFREDSHNTITQSLSSSSSRTIRYSVHEAADRKVCVQLYGQGRGEWFQSEVLLSTTASKAIKSLHRLWKIKHRLAYGRNLLGEWLRECIQPAPSHANSLEDSITTGFDETRLLQFCHRHLSSCTNQEARKIQFLWRLYSTTSSMLHSCDNDGYCGDSNSAFMKYSEEELWNDDPLPMPMPPIDGAAKYSVWLETDMSSDAYQVQCHADNKAELLASVEINSADGACSSSDTSVVIVCNQTRKSKISDEKCPADSASSVGIESTAPLPSLTQPERGKDCRHSSSVNDKIIPQLVTKSLSTRAKTAKKRSSDQGTRVYTVPKPPAHTKPSTRQFLKSRGRSQIQVQSCRNAKDSLVEEATNVIERPDQRQASHQRAPDNTDDGENEGFEVERLHTRYLIIVQEIGSLTQCKQAIKRRLRSLMAKEGYDGLPKNKLERFRMKMSRLCDKHTETSKQLDDKKAELIEVSTSLRMKSAPHGMSSRGEALATSI